MKIIIFVFINLIVIPVFSQYKDSITIKFSSRWDVERGRPPTKIVYFKINNQVFSSKKGSARIAITPGLDIISVSDDSLCKDAETAVAKFKPDSTYIIWLYPLCGRYELVPEANGRKGTIGFAGSNSFSPDTLYARCGPNLSDTLSQNHITTPKPLEYFVMCSWAPQEVVFYTRPTGTVQENVKTILRFHFLHGEVFTAFYNDGDYEFDYDWDSKSYRHGYSYMGFTGYIK